jgi:hypothetical protein
VQADDSAGDGVTLDGAAVLVADAEGSAVSTGVNVVVAPGLA